VRREVLARAPRKRALRRLGSAQLPSSGLLSATDEHMRASPPTSRLGTRSVVTSPDDAAQSTNIRAESGRRSACSSTTRTRSICRRAASRPPPSALQPRTSSSGAASRRCAGDADPAADRRSNVCTADRDTRSPRARRCHSSMSRRCRGCNFKARFSFVGPHEARRRACTSSSTHLCTRWSAICRDVGQGSIILYLVPAVTSQSLNGLSVTDRW